MIFWLSCWASRIRLLTFAGINLNVRAYNTDLLFVVRAKGVTFETHNLSQAIEEYQRLVREKKQSQQQELDNPKVY